MKVSPMTDLIARLSATFSSKRFLFVAFAITAALSSFAVFGSEFNPGFVNDTYQARHLWKAANKSLADKSFTCPDLIEPKVTFTSASIYKETPCRCEIDPDKKAAYDAEVEHIKQFNKLLVKLSDTYVQTPSERNEIAQCVVQHAEYWASNGAMLGDHQNSVGFHKTAETLGAVANSYLKIRHADNMPDTDEYSLIGSWMASAAEKVIDFYADSAGGRTRVNNHRYWDGFHVGKASVILQNQRLFDWAMEGLIIGLDQVTEDGILPREYERGSMAYKYHVYAVAPLVGLAELAIDNPGNMAEYFYPYAYNEGALPRLINMLLNEEGNADDTLFTRADNMQCHQAAWMEMYLHRSPRSDRDAIQTDITERRGNCNGKLKYTLLGGNMTLMAGKPTESNS
jgi:hypothetical protein